MERIQSKWDLNCIVSERKISWNKVWEFLHCHMTWMATGHEGSMPTVEASLVLSLLYMSEMLFL